MLRQLLKSKIHRALINDANIGYEGSITIPEDLMEAADLWEGEKVLVASIKTGARLETYVLRGPRGSARFVINGGAAHLINKGHRVTIMAFAVTDKPLTARKLLMDDRNVIIRDAEDRLPEEMPKARKATAKKIAAVKKAAAATKSPKKK